MLERVLKSSGVRRRMEIVALASSLLLLLVFATAFMLFVVKVQGAATAYMAGQSHWSRAQLGAVFALHRYKQGGEAVDLESARDLLDIPLGDMEARRAMEQPVLDRERTIEGLRRGQNHPEDIPGMIWLFRHFAGLPPLQGAVDVWRESDEHILALAREADRLESTWRDGEPDQEARQRHRQQLEQINAVLYGLTTRFVDELSEATRWMRQTLAMISVLTMALIALLASLSGWRLMTVINASRRRFQSIFEQAAVGMAEINREGRFINVNPALCKVLGCAREELMHQRYDSLIDFEDQDGALEHSRDILRDNGAPVTLEQRFSCPDGRHVWGKITVSTIAGKGGRPESFIVILEDVSESRRLSVELEYQASHDSMTGLMNRRSLERSVARALRSVREQQVEYALCFIDLDQFKVINDTCGHAAGDQILRQVSDLLRQQLREGDVIGRLGGDEFALLLRGCRLEDAARVSEKICQSLDELVFEWEQKTFSVTCSIGVVPLTKEASGIDSVLRSADIACYIAKEKGRNRVHVSRPGDEHVSRRHGEMEWVTRMRHALNEDRFYLDAQRIEPLQGQEELRYEVLLRLIDEDGKLVMPGAFLPAAERFDAAYRLDRWVIEHVCRRLADHPAHMQALGACHVNLSGHSFDRPDFLDFVFETLEHHGVPPAKICFEITETAAIRRLSDATLFMAALGEKDCRFALDDFGAGLSSFAYLRRLPVQYLKIDGAFVRNIARDKADLAMVRAINEIGQTLDKQIIAEFVETEETLELLREMGVHYAQGFAVHRPERFERLLGAKAVRKKR